MKPTYITTTMIDRIIRKLATNICANSFVFFMNAETLSRVDSLSTQSVTNFLFNRAPTKYEPGL